MSIPLVAGTGRTNGVRAFIAPIRLVYLECESCSRDQDIAFLATPFSSCYSA